MSREKKMVHFAQKNNLGLGGLVKECQLSAVLTVWRRQLKVQ